MKIKKKKLKSDVMYLIDTYTESGVYGITDENKTKTIVIVNKGTNFPTVYMLGPSNEWASFFDENHVVESEGSEGEVKKVSENFALKMLAIAINSDKIDKLH